MHLVELPLDSTMEWWIKDEAGCVEVGEGAATVARNDL